MQSNAVLLKDVNDFLETPIHVTRDGPSQLQNLLVKYNMDVAQIAVEISAHKEVAARFMLRSQEYPEGRMSLLTSPSVGQVLEHGSDENKKSLKFVLAEILSKDGNTLDVVSEAFLFELVPYTICWMSLECIAISNIASNLLYRVSMHNLRLCENVTSLSMNYLRTHPDLSSTVVLRYLSLFCRIIENGSEYFAVCMKYGCQAAVAHAVVTPDVLVQIVALEMLPSLACCSEGLDFLVAEKHLHWLVNGCSLSPDSVEELIRGQCLSAATDVLSRVESARHAFRSSESYSAEIQPTFFRGIEIALACTDEPNRALGLSAISSYATSSPSAFRTITSCHALLDAWLLLLRGQPSLQGATLHCLANVLLYPSTPVEDRPESHHQRLNGSMSHGGNGAADSGSGTGSVITGNEEEQPLRNVSRSVLEVLQAESGGDVKTLMEELCSSKKELFDRIGQAVGGHRGISSMDHLMKLVKQPICEVKIGSVDVMRSLAYQETPWGLHKLIGHPGFYAFLKDRTTEYTKEGKIWKFSLITAVANSPHCHLLSVDVSTHINLMLHQGPFFMPPELEEPMTEEL